MGYSSDNDKKYNKKVSNKKTESNEASEDVDEKPKDKKRPDWITTLNMKVEFGKYKGFKYSKMKRKDPAYCLWICENIKDPKGSLIDFIYHYKRIELDE